MKSIFRGFAFHFQGIQLVLTSAHVRRLFWLPLIVQILTFVALFTILIWSGSSLVSKLTPEYSEGFWSQTLYYISQLISYIILTIISGILSYGIGRVLALPFYSLMAEHVLTVYGQQSFPKLNAMQWIKFNISMIWVSILRLAILLVPSAILLLLAFVPIVQIVATLAALFLLAMDVTDYALEVSGKSLKARFRFIGQHKGELFGFSLGLGLTLLIPGLNLLLFPMTVASASLLVAKTSKQEKS